MKIARRFPVKRAPVLLALLLIVHLLILALAAVEFSFSWQLLAVSAACALSLYFNISRYLSLTNAPDDLCWSGENWLIQQPASAGNKAGSVEYLTLEGKSWISSFACILEFQGGGEKYAWFFSKHQLGKSAYSELCYLARQTIREQQAQMQKLSDKG